MSREVWDHSITCFLCSSISQKTKLQSWWSCWTRFSICPRWSINIGSQWDPETSYSPSLIENILYFFEWGMVRMTFGGICYYYTHFGEVNSILMFNRKLTTHCYSLILLPFRVFQTPFTWCAFSPTGSRTRGYSPSASRLSDASFLSHDFKSRLEDGNMNSRRAFKPPDWSQTWHIMASERREVK